MDSFTKNQLTEFSEAFALFDKDKSGRLRAEDVTVVMRSLGANVTDAEVLEMCKERDPENLTVTFNDLISMLQNAQSVANFDDEIIKAFNALDKDNSGYVPAVEIRTILTSVGEKLTHEEIDELFAFSDVDDETLVSFELFRRMVSFSI
ncbi:hypothetical protein GEMRC1_003844 [Eukaryota sp. GEM-RC1]